MERKITKLLLPAVLLCCMMESCYLYHPMMVDVPLLREKGELQVSGAAAINLSQMGFNATASWAPLNYAAVQGFGEVCTNGDYNLQGGRGTFWPLQNGWTTELYANAGTGYGSWEGSDHQGQPYEMWSHYQIYALQPNFGRVGKHFDFGVGAKCGLLNNSTTYTGRWGQSGEQEHEYYPNEQHLLLEPVAMIRFGWEHTKINLKVGYTYITGEDDHTRHFRYSSLNVGLGVTYKF